MPTWATTDLSVKPPSYTMGALDRVPLGFDAGQAIVGATVNVLDVTDAANPLDRDLLVEEVSLSGTGATVVVNGATAVPPAIRGHVYELAITFTNAAGRKWTRTLILHVRA